MSQCIGLPAPLRIIQARAPRRAGVAARGAVEIGGKWQAPKKDDFLKSWYPAKDAVGHEVPLDRPDQGQHQRGEEEVARDVELEDRQRTPRGWAQGGGVCGGGGGGVGGGGGGGTSECERESETEKETETNRRWVQIGQVK